MPPVTLRLIGANIAVFFLQMLMPAIVTPFALWPLGASGAGYGVGFEPWQLVTYAFLHGGMLHLAFNMFALYMFGSAIEQVFGGRRYLLYYMASVVSAALAQLGVAMLSGAIYPTVGA